MLGESPVLSDTVLISFWSSFILDGLWSSTATWMTSTPNLLETPEEKSPAV